VSKVDDHDLHKVIILGDSHTRGCSGKLTSIPGRGFTVIGISNPNANVSAIMDYKYLKTEKLSKNDVLIICGGARDVARNESEERLRKILEFIRFLSNTNVIVTSVPHRFDLQADSCVNKEVELFNRKLQKQMKTFGHVKICNLSDNREHFISHGLHMNPKGKRGITNKWARNHPLSFTPLPWIEVIDKGLVEHAKCKDSMMDRSELIEEDETVECTFLKLRKLSDQKSSLSNDGVELSVSELEMSLPVHAKPTTELEHVSNSVPRNGPLNSDEKDRNKGETSTYKNNQGSTPDQEALHSNRRKLPPPTRNYEFLWV
jgi:hypothetical protein